MTSVHPHPPPHRPRWWPALRRHVGLLLVAAVLLGVVVVAVAAGWAGWLVGHPGQAWAWIRQRLASSVLAVVVAALGVWVAWRTPRRQQQGAETLATAEHQWQREQEQERAAREGEQAAADQHAAWVQRCRSLLDCWPLPLIQDTSPYEIGVFYSRRADAYRGQRSRPPYVARTEDQRLAELLGSQPLVLIKGQSRAGKSRTAFEVAAQELAGWRLLVPKDRAALVGLGELGRLPGEGERVLVWLDDLDEYLATEGTGGLDAGLLGRLGACDPPMKVLATIRLEEYGRLAATLGELGRAIRELLNRFDHGALTLPVGFDDRNERAAIAELYPGEQVRKEEGLAEHLAAAHELVDYLEVGEASVPEGAGLVLAAVDCRRAGLDRPVSKSELAALLPLYLERLRPLVPVREGDVERGFGWATQPVGRTAALLVPDPDPLAGTFRVADPVVDFVERRDGKRLTIPAVWDRLLTWVSPREAVAVGFAAYTRGQREAARGAWQQVIDSGHPDAAPAAARNLGFLLAEQGDVAGARAADQQAIDSGHPDHAPIATVNLGVLLNELGDVAGARVAYRQAIDSGHQQATPLAAVNLGLLLAEQGDVAGARVAYRQAIDSGHPDHAPIAAVNLGKLLREQGDMAGARAAFQQAIDSGHSDQTPLGWLHLGLLLKEQGDMAGARAAFQQAIDSGHQEAAPIATFGVGVLLAEQGDVAGAQAAYRQATNSGHHGVVAAAQGALRSLDQQGRQTQHRSQ